jgi:hypothetical protein
MPRKADSIARELADQKNKIHNQKLAIAQLKIDIKARDEALHVLFGLLKEHGISLSTHLTQFLTRK